MALMRVLLPAPVAPTIIRTFSAFLVETLLKPTSTLQSLFVESWDTRLRGRRYIIGDPSLIRFDIFMRSSAGLAQYGGVVLALNSSLQIDTPGSQTASTENVNSVSGVKSFTQIISFVVVIETFILSAPLLLVLIE